MRPEFEQIWVAARLRMLSTEEGGRTQPFFKGYRPDHNFSEDPDAIVYRGQVYLKDRDQLAPGESCEARVLFIGSSILKELVTSGRVWRIQEGKKLVGMGEILSIDP
jgi:translation elongation factor EF-Tu-like GTPase